MASGKCIFCLKDLGTHDMGVGRLVSSWKIRTWKGFVLKGEDSYTEIYAHGHCIDKQLELERSTK